jgi:hypothetical protein
VLLLLPVLHFSADYTLCIYQTDPSACPPSSTPIDLSQLSFLNSTTFPDPRFFAIFLATSVPLNPAIFSTFLPSQPLFSFVGLSASIARIDVSRPFRFEFEFTNANLVLSGDVFEVSSLGLSNCQISGDLSVSISTMSFCTDFSSLKYVDEVTSCSFQFLGFPPGSLFERRTRLMRRGQALPSVTIEGFSQDSVVLFYGSDIAIERAGGGMRVYLVLGFSEMRIIVNHSFAKVNVSLVTVYSRGLDALGDVSVITGDQTVLSVGGGDGSRPISVYPKGSTVIEHRGGDIPLFVKSSGFPIEIRAVGTLCQLRTLELKRDELRLTGSGRVVIERICGSSNVTITGNSGSLSVTINDVSSAFDTDLTFSFLGPCSYSFVNWTDPRVHRVVSNLELSPVQSFVGFTLDRMPTTYVTGALDMLGGFKDFMLEFQSEDLPLASDIDAHYGMVQQFLVADDLPCFSLSLSLAPVNRLPGFAPGASLFTQQCGSALGLQMSSHVSDINNLFCLADSADVCPENATFLAVFSDFAGYVTDEIECIRFVIFRDSEVLLTGAPKADVSISAPRRGVSVRLSGESFASKSLCLENLIILVDEPCDVRSTVSMFDCLLHVADGQNLRFTNTKLAGSAAVLRNVSTPPPTIELFDLQFDTALLESSRMTFLAAGSEIEAITTATTYVQVHSGTTYPHLIAGNGMGQTLHLSDVFAREIAVNSTWPIAVTYERFGGHLFTFDKEVAVGIDHAQGMRLSSVVPAVVFPHILNLESEFQIDPNITNVRFNNLMYSSGAHIARSEKTDIVVVQISFPQTCLWALGNLSVSGTIIAENWNEIDIANLSVVSDSKVAVNIGPMIPFVEIGGKWERRLTISVAGLVPPGAIKAGEEIQIVCFREMPCVIGDLSTINWNDTFELNCSGNCAVVRLRSDVPDDDDSSNTVYIIVGVCGGVVIVIALIVAIVCVRKRKQQSAADSQLPDERHISLVTPGESEPTLT